MTVLLNKKTTSARTTLHPATIMRKVREGNFPQPVQLGSARIAFIEDEVEEWIKARVNDRDEIE
jgi:prophage regulatory protein